MSFERPVSGNYQESEELKKINHPSIFKFDGVVAFGEHWIVKELVKSVIRVPKGTELTIAADGEVVKSTIVDDGGKINTEGAILFKSQIIKESKEAGPSIATETKTKPESGPKIVGDTPKLETTKETLESESHFRCRQCGTVLSHDAKICHRCGSLTNKKT